MKIERINKGSWGKVRAFFDIRTQDGFIVKGFSIVEGINGLFVSFPSKKGQDDEYYNTVIADRDLRDELTQLAMKEYGGDIMTPAPAYSNSVETAPMQANRTEISAPYSDDDIPF